MMQKIIDLLRAQPVIFINAIVAIVVVAAGYGLDVDPDAVRAALVSLVVSAAALWPNVFAPSSVDDLLDEQDDI